MNKVIRVRIKSGTMIITGDVLERNLFEFNNHLDSVLMVRNIPHSKGIDFCKGQIDYLEIL